MRTERALIAALTEVIDSAQQPRIRRPPPSSYCSTGGDDLLRHLALVVRVLDFGELPE